MGAWGLKYPKTFFSTKIELRAIAMKFGGDVEGFMQNPGKIKFRGSVPPGGRGGLGGGKNRKNYF